MNGFTISIYLKLVADTLRIAKCKLQQNTEKEFYTKNYKKCYCNKFHFLPLVDSYFVKQFAFNPYIMEFTPNLVTISTVFEGKIFLIPDFQRGYSWTKKQLDDLWNDLCFLSDDQFHFTGSIALIHPNKDEVNSTWKISFPDATFNFENNHFTAVLNNKQKYNLYYIVDGQQRLTTIMIFLHEFFESGILSESEINNKKNELFGSLNHWFRLNYEPQNSNYTFYNTILFHKTHAELPKFFENAYSKNLYEAKDFFKKKLDAANSFEERRAIKKIVKNLFERFLFSTYLLDERLDVHRVFETMNNRGRQLSKLELLKNRIIYLTSSLNIIYEKKLEIRNRINNVWKQIYAYLAKNPKSILRDDAFLKVHGIMYFDHTEASDSEMKEFTESTIETYFSLDLVRNKTENPKFITKYLDSLEKSIKNWYFIKNPSAENSPYSKDIIKWLTKLNRLSPNTFFEPLILAIAEKEFDNNEFVTILKKIEIHEFLVFKLSGARSNKNRVKFYHLASEFYNRSELSIDDICNRIGAKTKEYYNANKFQTHMNTLFKDNKKRNWRDWVGLEYFLWEYEEYLCNLSNNEMLAQWGKQSIDFILPENFSKNGTWGVSFSSVGADKQRRYCYALGNLLLVSKKRTDPESKKIESFEDKKTPQRVGLREIGYSIGSYSEREVARHPDWTPQSIFERSLKLLDFMADRFEIQIDSIRKSLTNVNYEANYVKIEEEEHDF